MGNLVGNVTGKLVGKHYLLLYQPVYLPGNSGFTCKVIYQPVYLPGNN